ncbi:hypothetical protein [Actinophytocola sp. NPDC049390]|uniref:hypothetical protein n=1 Tax=Actinophytocola sp. NPDC049390 TaxID=3363894 RepID=UPI00379C2A2F
MDTSDRPDPALEPVEPDQPLAIIPVVEYEQAPTFAQYGPPPMSPPPPPPKPAGPPKSVTGAALLNLTGLGLGYAYLRNHVLAVLAFLLTGGAVTVAFLTGAADRPWLWRGAVLGWLVLLALHAAFLASRRAPGPRTRGPVLAGVVAVAVVAAGYAGYGVAGAAAYDRGVAAQEAGDCVAAADAFDTVTGPFELTLSADVLDARDRSAECAAYEKARAAQNRDDYESAIVLYDDFGKLYPDSVLSPYVRDNLADTHFAKATSWQEPVTAVVARLSVDTLLMLGREFGDTDAAKQAPAAIDDVFAAATKPYGAGKFCDSLEVLTYFAGLDATSVGKKVSADANTFRARSLYECGMRQYRDKKLSQAVTTFGMFLTGYPKDRRAAQVKAARIAAEVAAAAKVTIPVPPPLGGNNPGPIPITFYNDSQDAVTIYIAGPTAHEITLPACPSCPATYPENDPAACANLNGRPSVTVRLKTSTYYYLATSSAWTEGLAEPITLEANYEYEQCLFTTPH